MQLNKSRERKYEASKKNRHDKRQTERKTSDVLRATVTPGRRQRRRFVYAHRGGYNAYRTGIAQDDAPVKMHAEARENRKHAFVHT